MCFLQGCSSVLVLQGTIKHERSKELTRLHPVRSREEADVWCMATGRSEELTVDGRTGLLGRRVRRQEADL